MDRYQLDAELQRTRERDCGCFDTESEHPSTFLVTDDLAMTTQYDGGEIITVVLEASPSFQCACKRLTALTIMRGGVRRCAECDFRAKDTH